MHEVRVFLSFDLDHDGDLPDRLVEQSQKLGSGFRISARSQRGDMSDGWNEGVRRRICEADEVIVICGEHTEGSAQVSAEVRIAQEEDKPYFLLWGRREAMCTKPLGARSTDGMYSWTPSILQEQIAAALRKAQPIEVPDRCKRP